MLPSAGGDPRINIIRIGAFLLEILREGPSDVGDLLKRCADAFQISIDHVILSLDWLFMISAIRISGEKVEIHET
ncbi:MAG: hypothetical protein C0490_10250 [Marivirga sp.]|nr:hypothetical protein [Marivirga sp.]